VLRQEVIDRLLHFHAPDEATAAVLDSGGHVEHVYADTALAGPVLAVYLRFPVAKPTAGTGL
jgi:hypothetical protein